MSKSTGKTWIAVGSAGAGAQVDEIIGYCQRIMKHPGCRTCNAGQDLRENNYRIYQEWDTKEHFAAFLRSGESEDLVELSTLYEADPFVCPGVQRKANHAWAKAERKDLTKTEGKLFFLSEDGRTRHAIFNNTGDQYDVQMRFPKQQMKPAARNVEQDEADSTKFKVTVFPGETVPFVNGKWNGGYALSFSWGPVSDPDYLAQQAARIDARIKAETDEFRNFLSSKGLDSTSPPGICKTIRFQEQAAKLALAHHKQYIDLSFPPDQKSVDKAGLAPKRGWMRPQDFLPPEFKDKFELEIGTLEPGDIDQGALGNCWFMAAIAACAEMPDMLIRPLFSNYNEQKSDEQRKNERYLGRDHGFYKVHLAKNGWWRWHIVDTFLPVHPVDDPGAPIFAKNKEEPAELWVAILEKTYAKLHGCYQELSGGDPAVALSDLTGFPCITFPDWPEDRRNFHDSRNPLGQQEKKDWTHLFKQVLHHDKKGRMIWVTSPGVDTSGYMQGGGVSDENQRKAEKYEDVGLVSGHAYTCLAAVECEGGPKGLTQLVMIRNPWGGGKEWNKDWNDDDPKWQQYPHIMAKCMEKGREANDSYTLKSKDGTFWMDWADVREYFDSGGVCLKHGRKRAQEQWQDVRFRTSFQDGKPCHFIRFQPTSDCDCLAFASQHDRRGLEPGDSRKDMCALRLDVITPSEKRSMYDTVAWSNKGVFMYAHQALAVDTKSDGPDDFEDAFPLKKGQTYYFVVRQHPDEQNPLVRNRGGIILTIQTSPGLRDNSKVRGFKAFRSNEAVAQSCKYKGYYGLTDDGAEVSELVENEHYEYGVGSEDDCPFHIAVQLDGLDRGTDGQLLAADERNWPSKTQRW